MHCRVCLDVALDSKRLFDAGEPINEISAMIRSTYGPLYGTITPTPLP